jgi:hypothetical protein
VLKVHHEREMQRIAIDLDQNRNLADPIFVGDYGGAEQEQADPLQPVWTALSHWVRSEPDATELRARLKDLKAIERLNDVQRDRIAKIERALMLHEKAVQAMIELGKEANQTLL